MNIQIRTVGDPVVFTNNAGGGHGEIQAPANDYATLQLHAGGGTVVAAWYCAIDNLGDLTKIHYICCQPDGDHVNLVVKGFPGNVDGRVRVRVYAAVSI